MKKLLKIFIIFKTIIKLNLLREVKIDKSNLLINIKFLIKGRKIILIR